MALRQLCRSGAGGPSGQAAAQRLVLTALLGRDTGLHAVQSVQKVVLVNAHSS